MGGRWSVFLSWAKHPTDKEDEENTIGWDINQDGSFKIGVGDNAMELGWQAFSFVLIDNEINAGDNDANVGFLHDLSNLNFVKTSQGDLGNLLAEGRCSLGDPIRVMYFESWGGEKPEKGDFWRLQLSVNCNTPGPRYFTHDGLVLFFKQRTAPWRPYSFFAHRIATYAPGSWFILPDPVEQQAFNITATMGKAAGLNANDIEALGKIAELRNDGSIIHW